MKSNLASARVVIARLRIDNTLGIDRARVHLARIVMAVFGIQIIGRVEAHQIVAFRVLDVHSLRAHADSRARRIDDCMRTLREHDLVLEGELVGGERLRIRDRRDLIGDLTARANRTERVVCVLLLVVFENNLSVRVDSGQCAIDFGVSDYLFAVGIEAEELLSDTH